MTVSTLILVKLLFTMDITRSSCPTSTSTTTLSNSLTIKPSVQLQLQTINFNNVAQCKTTSTHTYIYQHKVCILSDERVYKKRRKTNSSIRITFSCFLSSNLLCFNSLTATRCEESKRTVLLCRTDQHDLLS